MEEGIKGIAFFYNTFSELFLTKDYYYLNQLCENMTTSDYSEHALRILEHINSRRLPAELDLIDEVSLLERDYREVDKNQLIMSYEHFGYRLEEGYEPDHIGIELKFLALLCLEEDITKAYINQYRFIHNRLSWLRYLEDSLKGKGLMALKDCLSFLTSFLRDHKAFLMKQLRIEPSH
ncbi:MAG: molecular chaperone TorD family protein [Aquificaceae bacterium]